MKDLEPEDDRVTGLPEHQTSDDDRFLDSPLAALLASGMILLVIFLTAVAGSTTM